MLQMHHAEDLAVHFDATHSPKPSVTATVAAGSDPADEAAFQASLLDEIAGVDTKHDASPKAVL
jgi:hypothetical protein